MTTLELKNLSKIFPDAGKDLTIIKDLSYVFPEKGLVGIMGRSGIGKSTLLYLLGGLDLPSGGSVFIDGTDVTSLKTDQLSDFRGKNIGFIFQFHHLLPEFSAIENVAMPLIIQGESEESSKMYAKELLDKVSLSHRDNHLPGQLSGGEQQRVAIARALVSRPKLILADEPTGSLDPTTGSQIASLLTDISKESSSLVIVVTHNRDLAENMDTVIEMSEGGILRQI